MEAISFIPGFRQTPYYIAESTIRQKIESFLSLFFFSCTFLGNLKESKSEKTHTFRKLAQLYTLCKILQAAAGYIVYKSTHYSIEHLDKKAAPAHEALKEAGFIIEPFDLYRSGTYYSALSIKHQNADPKKWFINARGINDTMEKSLRKIVERNAKDGYNTLIINGPAVGKSTGWPTPFQLAAGVEAGMQYLENLGAKYVVVDGHSWGVGMTSEAALLHDFRTKLARRVHYLFISDRTFDTFLNVATATVARFVDKTTAGYFPDNLKKIVAWTLSKSVYAILTIIRYDLNCVKGAKKLDELGIKHLVIQVEGDTDHRIPESVSLMSGLKKIDLSNLSILKSREMHHSRDYPEDLALARSEEIRKFYENSSIK